MSPCNRCAYVRLFTTGIRCADCTTHAARCEREIDREIEAEHIKPRQLYAALVENDVNILRSCIPKCIRCKDTKMPAEMSESRLKQGVFVCKTCERRKAKLCRQKIRATADVWSKKLLTLRGRFGTAGLNGITGATLERVYEAFGRRCALTGREIPIKEAAFTHIYKAAGISEGNLALVRRFKSKEVASREGFEWDNDALKRIAFARSVLESK